MLEKLQGLPSGIEAVRAVGRLSKADYEVVLEPLLQRVRREGRHVRFLYEFGPEFEGLTPGAAWEDAKVGLRYMRLFEACAIVTDHGWIRDATKLASFLMPCPVRVFANQDRAAAIDWLRSLPETPSIVHRLLPDSGVIVVEVKQALRAGDFDALAATADTWIEAHGNLRGLVIHAREFPGWENLSALLGHVRFVRDHQRKIERIALAASGTWADAAPRLGEHFIHAEVKRFSYEDLDAAVEWASGTTQRAS